LREGRPAPIVFVNARTLPAGIVQQSLAEHLPDRLPTLNADRVDSLDFDGPLAAAAINPKHMALDLGQPPPTG
jgi:hypothetical protein